MRAGRGRDAGGALARVRPSIVGHAPSAVQRAGLRCRGFERRDRRGGEAAAAGGRASLRDPLGTDTRTAAGPGDHAVALRGLRGDSGGRGTERRRRVASAATGAFGLVARRYFRRTFCELRASSGWRSGGGAGGAGEGAARECPAANGRPGTAARGSARVDRSDVRHGKLGAGTGGDRQRRAGAGAKGRDVRGDRRASNCWRRMPTA